MGILLTFHSINRWLIVIASLLAIYFLIKDVNSKSTISKNGQIFSSLFTGLMDLQLLLGLMVYLLPKMMGDRNSHTAIMFLAILVAHLPAFYKKKEPLRYPTIMLGSIVLALALIMAGTIPIGGILRWIHIFGIF